MADALGAIRTYILAQSSVNDLIAQRLYLGRRPEGSSLPCATITRTSEDHNHLLTGRSGLVKTRMQIVVYSDRHSGTTGASTIAEKIYQCGIDQIKGTTNGVDIRGITVEDGRREGDFEDTAGGDDQTYFSEFDLMVSYLE